MAELRGVQPPSSDAQNSYANALAGFSEAIVEKVCGEMERAQIVQYEAKMPGLPMMIESCKRVAQAKKSRPFCGKCDQGWIEEMREDANYSTPLRYVRRCPCRTEAA